MRNMKSKRKKYSKAPSLPPTQLVHKHQPCRVKQSPFPPQFPSTLFTYHQAVFGRVVLILVLRHHALAGPVVRLALCKTQKMRACRSTIISKGVILFQA